MPRRLTAMSPRMKLPELSGALWKAYAAGQVTEEEASQLSDLIKARKVISAPREARAAARRLLAPFLCLDGSPSLLGRRRPIQAPSAEEVEAKEHERAEQFKRDQLLPIMGWSTGAPG